MTRPSSSRKTTSRVEVADASRQAVLGAAERCIERYGIRKTTMEDIAREAGMSRPSIYRFFADRQELLVALTGEHSRRLAVKARNHIAKQPTFADALVEGLMYLAEHGRRDGFTRNLIVSDDSTFGPGFGATPAAAELTADFWDEFLDKAAAAGELRADVPRELVHIWLANVGIMLMALLDGKQPPKEAYRKMVRELVVPGLLSPSSPAPRALKRA